MKKAHLIILSVILAVGLIGCGKENVVSTEGIAQNSDRVYGKECWGVVTISINPEVDLEVDDEGNVLSVVFQNEDAELAYGELKLEGTPVDDAIRCIVETADEKGYLADDGEVTLIYGSTGNASAEEARSMIESARNTVTNTVNELGKESIVALEMKNYAQETADICDLCFGVGSIVCDLCGGSSYGNGMVKCDLCMGTGIYDDGHNPEDGGGPVDDGLCRTCRGTGIMTIQAQTCYICKGTGLCINCGGSGQDTGNFSGPDVGEESGNEPPSGCNRCAGTGYMVCNRCNGTGINTH